MKILAIECTHRIACVAVKNGGTLVEECVGEWQKTAEAIVPLVGRVMDASGLRPQELDCVAVSSGPGSFTALRIGMSAAKGIAYGAGCPLVPVPTLTAMAVAASRHVGAEHLVPVVPSRPGEYFYAVFRRLKGSGALEELVSSRCMSGELEGRLGPFLASAAVVGRDVALLAEAAESLAPNCLEASFFTAASLLPDAEHAVREARYAGVQEVMPDYRQIFVPGSGKQ